MSGQQPEIFVESRRLYWLLGIRTALESFLEYFQSLKETIRGREHGVANSSGCLLVAAGVFPHVPSFYTVDLCLKIAELEQLEVTISWKPGERPPPRYVLSVYEKDPYRSKCPNVLTCRECAVSDLA